MTPYTLTLQGYWRSSASWRVRVALHLKGLDYRYEAVHLVRDGGELAYFEYAGVRAMKAPFLRKPGRERLRRIDALGKSMRRKHDGRRELVLGNLPPAFAVRLTGGPERGR